MINMEDLNFSLYLIYYTINTRVRDAEVLTELPN